MELIKDMMKMHSTLKEMNRVDLINIERSVHILKGISEVGFKTL